MIQGVIHSDIPYVWKDAEPHIKRSLKYADGKYDIASVREMLNDRSAQLWLEVDNGIESAAVTQIHIYPLKKVCAVMFAGGVNPEKFKHNIRRIEEWAKAQGCESTEVWGRKGWEKVLNDYSVISTMLSKELR